MKLTLGELRPLMDTLPLVIDAKGLPFKTAYWLGRALDQITSAFTPFEKARQLLVNKYATKDENGELILKPDSNEYVIDDPDALQEEWVELASEEIEIKYEPLALDAFGDKLEIEGTDDLPTFAIIMRLGRLIKEENEAPEPLEIVKGEG